MDKDNILGWQSDLENTKERPLHQPSQDQSKSTALGGVWIFAERCIIRENKVSHEYALQNQPMKTEHKLSLLHTWFGYNYLP